MYKLFLLCVFASLAISSHARMLDNYAKNKYGRIVNGENAVNGQFPWSGRVIIGTTSCSCTLIALNRVLTSSTCVDVMQGGTTFFGDVSRNGGVQRTFRPEDIVLHPRASEGGGFLIAVLRLPTAYEPSNLITPIALPTDATNFFDYMIGYFTGYGRMADNVQAEILQWTPMRVMSRADCTTVFGLRESVMCGRWHTSNGCDGDGGAGFAMQVGSTWHVIGVYNFGLAAESCQPGGVLGMARVSDHLSWLRSV